MKLLLLSMFLIGGCAPYARVQVALVDQCRKGLVYSRDTQASYAQVLDQLHALQRRQLDDAFDADVRSRPSIDAQWVIDARRVYAAAIDAMAERYSAARQSALTAQQNLDAVDQALQQLRYLQSIPLSWLDSTH